MDETTKAAIKEWAANTRSRLMGAKQKGDQVVAADKAKIDNETNIFAYSDNLAGLFQDHREHKQYVRGMDVLFYHFDEEVKALDS